MYAARFLGPVCCLLSLTALLAAEGKVDIPTPPTTDSKADDGSQSRFARPQAPDEVGGRSIESWMRDLTSVDASTRANAILNIVAFRENAAPAISALIDRFHDGDTSPRVKAVMAFRFLPEVPKNRTAQVINALAQVLTSDTQAIVRYEAAVTLKNFAGKNKAAIPALIQGTQDRGTWEIRHACVDALLGAGWDPEKGPDPRVTRALLKSLQDSTHEVKLRAIMTLGFMGRPPDPQLFQQVVTDLHAWARSRTAHKTSVLWAHVSLVLLGDNLKEKSLDAIANNLKAKERDTRIQGINALGVLGEKARSKVQDLTDMLNDPEDPVIIAATEALTRMNDRGQRVLGPLISLTKLSKDHATVVYAAIAALHRIGNPDPAVLKALEDVNQREKLPKELRYFADTALKDLLKPKKEEKGGQPREVPRDNDRPALDKPVGRRGR